MSTIYRGDMSNMEADERPVPGFKFSAEHAWLKDAVALRLDESTEPQVVEGEVHDGCLGPEDSDEGLVMDGVDVRAALHRACWELSGRKEYKAIASITGLEEWQNMTKYHKQLFSFEELAKDGFAWKLADPTLDWADSQKNRRRIQEMLSHDSER